jgi:pimeloyl-ACP methyl ester carboxylesterase
LEVPVLVLSGEHDRMTLPSASAHMEDLLPDDRPCQVSSNHLGMWECPERFAAVLTEFAEDLAVRKPRVATTPIAS